MRTAISRADVWDGQEQGWLARPRGPLVRLHEPLLHHSDSSFLPINSAHKAATIAPLAGDGCHSSRGARVTRREGRTASVPCAIVASPDAPIPAPCISREDVAAQTRNSGFGGGRVAGNKEGRLRGYEQQLDAPHYTGPCTAAQHGTYFACLRASASVGDGRKATCGSGLTRW